MGDLFISHLIQALLWRNGRSPARPDDTSGALILEYGRLAARIIWVYCLAVPMLAGVVGWIFPPPDSNNWYPVSGVIVVAELAGLLFALPVARVKIVIDQDGIRAHRILGHPRSILWEEVRKVAWSKLISAFVIRSQCGQKIRVYAYLCGLTDLTEAFRQCLAPDIYQMAVEKYEKESRAWCSLAPRRR